MRKDLMCFFKQKTAYGLLISDWSSDVCSSDLEGEEQRCRCDPFYGRPGFANRFRSRDRSDIVAPPLQRVDFALALFETEGARLDIGIEAFFLQARDFCVAFDALVKLLDDRCRNRIGGTVDRRAARGRQDEQRDAVAGQVSQRLRPD